MARASQKLSCLHGLSCTQNRVGGGEGLEGVYGSITRTGTAEVLDAFKTHAGLNSKSVMLDIGSGLGRCARQTSPPHPPMHPCHPPSQSCSKPSCAAHPPSPLSPSSHRPLLHSVLHSSVSATYGIEVDAVKCQKAVPFVQHIVKELEDQGISLDLQALPKFICAPIEQVCMPSRVCVCVCVCVWMDDSLSALGGHDAIKVEFGCCCCCCVEWVVFSSFTTDTPDPRCKTVSHVSPQIPSLEPATHIYAAWEGFARGAMEAVGKLFSESSTAHAITIVQRSFRCVWGSVGGA
jgi:hypothetical protein